MDSSTNSQQQQQKRRASESEAQQLALVSSSSSSANGNNNNTNNFYYNRIPPPLPYLPSDYRPSPDSPRHFMVASAPASTSPYTGSFFDLNSGKRQRSRSIGHPLAIENNSPAVASNSSNVSHSQQLLQAPQQQQHFELVPYREWTVIARNNIKGQIVLYNQDNQSVTVQHYLPDNHFRNLDPNIPIQVTKEENDCPYCHRPLNRNPSSPTKLKPFDEPDYMDRNYFRLLASSQTNTATDSPAQSRSGTFSSQTPDLRKPGPSHTSHPSAPISSQNLNANAFNQGYYSKFFVEENKLGKGFRGSVFLCEHMLDGVKLGKYAIKKVAIGNNHPWLVRMLREVHLLERLRHPNIVTYKHSWLEYNRLTPFGPEVPCLFILMECANGGNLEEYFEPHIKQDNKTNGKEAADGGEEAGGGTKQRKLSRQELKRERIRKQYQEQQSFEQEHDVSSPTLNIDKRLLTMTEIWSLFLDIVQGLAHLHQQNIVHRDLKPPNLLLQYDIRNRHHHKGIPRILISDFGECEDLDETHPDNDNRTGATGTLEFMAPEHVRLDPRGRNTVDYSPKADMWSLGMVLYYLCYSRLPYSIIDDVDILRAEILDFKDIRFPRSRFEIYNNNPILMQHAQSNPDIQADIPQEVKMLIRSLLSVDPSKRPSCNEILRQLRSIRRGEETLFQEIPNDWSASSSSSVKVNGAGSAAAASSSATATVQPMPTPSSSSSTTRGVMVVEEEEEEIDQVMEDISTERARARSMSPSKRSPSVDSSNLANGSSSGTTQRNGSSVTSLRKRQRLLHNNAAAVVDDECDTIMAENSQAPPPPHPPRLLLGSPDIPAEEGHLRLTEKQIGHILKTITAIVKVASCTWTCAPYSTRPSILYPVIFLATMDFWHTESITPNFLLIVLHLIWLMATTLLYGGLCEA